MSRAVADDNARQIVSAWVQPELAQRLEEAARAAHRSRSAELRIALRRYLERDEKEVEQ